MKALALFLPSFGASMKSWSLAALCLAWLAPAAALLSGQEPEAKGDTVESTLFDFEDGSTQGFWGLPGVIQGISISKVKAFDGKHSLAVDLDGDRKNAETKSYLKTLSGIFTIEPGSTVFYRIWIPDDGVVTSVIPYVQSKLHFWTGNTIEKLERGAWNTCGIKVPDDAVVPLEEMGLYINADKGGKTRVYVDAVSYTLMPDQK
jgi:hypothetical protein